MIGFIGAGKVGFSLGKLFEASGIHVTGYYSRHVEDAREAAEFTGSTVFYDLETVVEKSNIIFITVPDGEIGRVYTQLADYDLQNKQICHCSGSLTAAEVFPDLAGRGAYGYSIHPLFPVSSRYESYRDLAGAFFCLEGDEKYLSEWEQRLRSIAAGVRIIANNDKVKYHAACVVSSNLVCALWGESLRLLSECGFTEEEAGIALAPLATANLNRLIEVGPAQALTGPLERADVGTIEKHLECFETNTEREMYRTLSLLLLREAKEKNPNRDYAKVNDVLGGIEV